MSIPSSPVNLRVNEATGENLAKNFEDLYARLARLNGDFTLNVVSGQQSNLFQQIRTVNGSLVVGITGEGSTKAVITL